MESKVYCAAVY